LPLERGKKPDRTGLLNTKFIGEAKMLFFITIDESIKQWDDPESIEVRVRRERVGKESIMKRE
jgi:hypothetical protein